MTLQEFKYLPFQKKLELVKNSGEFADSYTTKVEMVKCYAIHRFFVEITYDLKTNKIKKIHGFITGISLDKYVINFNNCNNQY